MPADTTEILDAERAHLAASRAALHQMRAESADWRDAVGGNSVSTQYLKQMLHRRMAELELDPDVPLFFGRIEYAAALGAQADEVFHIGRRHVASEAGGEPLVMDWRAPMSLPFYRARPSSPMGCSLRRRFGFQHGELTAFEDEPLTGPDAPGGGVSDILRSEIERPRTGPMRDIVATIQPDQDVLVRTDLTTSLAIQGAPGTGKTAVGLHRAAWLLYEFRDHLSRAGILVIGPNESFLSYIADVLPALGEIDAGHDTIGSLVARSSGLAVRRDDPAEVAVLKGDARLADVCRRAVWGHLAVPSTMLVVPLGHRQWRVPVPDVASAVAGLAARGVRYEAGRQLLPQRLAHQVLIRMEAVGETTDDRVQSRVARTGPVREATARCWPRLDPVKLTHRLLTDPVFLAAHADGLLDADEQRLLQSGTRARNPGSMRWSLADLVIVDEVSDLLERTGSLGHVIVDEAQDLSAMQLRAVGRRASTGSVTLLGDLAQATTPWATRDWSAALGHVGHPDARLHELVEGFRVPGEVLDFAARLLPYIAPGLTPPRAIRADRGMLTIRRAEPVVGAVADACRAALVAEGTVGLIVPDTHVASVAGALDRAELEHHHVGDDVRGVHRLDLVPASLAKGLEFDHVVLVDPAGIVAAEADRETGLRRLYVCLTRAVMSLRILHDGNLPPELRRD